MEICNNNNKPHNQYKEMYCCNFLMQKNWNHGYHKHTSIPSNSNHVVRCLQFDSEKIVAGFDDTCIYVYDITNGEMMKRLKGHNDGVCALQYIGKTLVSGSIDNTIRVWDLEKGVCTHMFLGHTDAVRCLLINFSSNLIITGSRDFTIKIWKLPNLDVDPTYVPSLQSDSNPYYIRTLHAHNHSIRALDGVGNTLVSGSYDHTVRVWNVMTGRNIWCLRGHRGKVYSVALDAKNKRCMSGSSDGTIKIWSIEDGTNLWTLESI